MKSVFTDALNKIINPTKYDYIDDNLCIRELSENTLLKAEIINRYVLNNYDTLQIEIIDKKMGVVDTTMFAFREVADAIQINPNFKDAMFPYITASRLESVKNAHWHIVEPDEDWFNTFRDKVYKYYAQFFR